MLTCKDFTFLHRRTKYKPILVQFVSNNDTCNNGITMVLVPEKSS